MTERAVTGKVAGATAMERAVRIAGAIAELGIQQLILRVNGKPIELEARHTDLPGTLVASGGAWDLECPRLLIKADGTWTAQDDEAADVARRTLEG